MAVDYGALIDRGAEDDDQRLSAAMLAGRKAKPDAYARAVELGEKHGIDPAIVERNLPEVEARDFAASLDPVKMRRDNPALYRWLQDPKNASVAHDDLANLSRMEWLLTAPGRAYRRGQSQVELGSLRYRSMFGEVDRKRMDELEADMQAGDEYLGAGGVPGRMLVGSAQQLPMLFGSLREGARLGIPAAIIGGTAALVAGQAGPQIAAPEELFTVPGAAVAFGGAGFTAGATQFNFEQEAGHAYGEFTAIQDESGAPLDPDVAKVAALAAGGLNAGLETLGLGILLKSIPGVDKLIGGLGKNAVREALKSPTVRGALKDLVVNYGSVLASETAVEVTQRAVTIMAGELARYAEGIEGRTAGEIGRDLANEGKAAVYAFGLIAAPGPLVRAGMDVHSARRAQARAQLFEALGETAAESKLGKRLPAKLQEFVARHTAGGPVENVYIPIERFNTYFQEQGLNPAAVAEEILGDKTAYEQALAAGGDLVIPTAAYAAKVAGTKHNAALAKVLRLHPDEMTAEEADEWMARQSEEAEASAGESQATPTEQIAEDVKGQLLAAGYEPTAAETNAQITAAAYATMAERSGIDPMEFYRANPLRVRGEIPAALQKPGALNELDGLIDRLRRGDVPSENEAYGPSLTEFISGKGGIEPDVGGDLQSMDLGKIVVGGARLMREGGMRLDRMVEAAFEAGYINEHDHNAFLEALSTELGGRKVYTLVNNSGDAKAANVRGAVEDLARWLEEQGIDLAATSNEEIKARLVGPTGGTVMEQRPLIVQHNLSAANLRHARRLGGLPVPSLAITLAESPLTGFGEITLIGDPAMADPKGYARPKVFGADIYSPRYPSIHYKIDQAGQNTLGRLIAKHADLTTERYFDLDSLQKEGVDYLRTNSAVMAETLERAGVQIEPRVGDEAAESNKWRLNQLVGRRLRDAIRANNLDDQLLAVATEVFASLNPTERIFRGYTNMGNRRYIAHTLENVVAILKKDLRGGEGFNYGVGSLRAKFTPQFRSVAQIKREAGRLLTKDQFEAVKGEVDKEFWRITEALGIRADTVIAVIEDAAKMGVPRALREYQVEGVGEDVQADIAKFMTRLRHLPTEYFETKVLRDVDLAEFRVAVVPSDLPADAREILTGRGLTVVEYDRAGGDSARREAVRNAAQAGGLMFQAADGSNPRGQIAIGTKTATGRTFDITLLERANLSTFIHESGHQFLEMMGDLAERPGTPEQVAKDWQTILAWLGVKDRSEIRREHHEKWARGFEAYAMEGKAPSVALRRAFARFRAWLVALYRELARLNVDLTDDVRRVMDRMLATDEAIAAAEYEAGVAPLFADAATAGMTERQFAAYTGEVLAASEQARDSVMARLMRQLTREQQKWWKDERKRVLGEVEDEIDKLPVYRALAGLRAGPMKLSRPFLEREFGKATRPRGKPKAVEPPSGMLGSVLRGKPTQAPPVVTPPNEIMNRLTALRVMGAEGVAPDIAADAFGFGSGQALVNALVNARPRKDVIEAETDRRMQAAYPDIRFDGTLADEAAAAVQNEGREEILRAEIRALRAKQRMVEPHLAAARADQREARRQGVAAIRSAAPDLDTVREAARRILAAKKLRDIRPAEYLATARRQARMAIEAAALGDKAVKEDLKRGLQAFPSGWAWAADLKQRELLNFHLYREALKIREQADKDLAFVKSLDKKATRQRLGKADALEAVEDVLSRFDFRPMSATRSVRQDALAAFVARMAAQGVPIDLPEHILRDARRRPWQSLTYEEFRGVVDGLRHIVHMALFKDRLLAAADKRDLDAVAAGIVAEIDGNHDRVESKPVFGEDWKDRMVRKGGRFRAEHTKMEFLFRWLDGEENRGRVWRALFKPLADAENAEAKMMRAARAELAKIMKPYSAAERAGWYMTRLHIPELDAHFTRASLLALALNWGNQGNREAVVRGSRGKWTEAAVTRALNESLTEQEWQTVQEIWNFIDSFWPQIRELQEDFVGVAPQKVEATPVTTPFGTLRGGYYPLKYDSTRSFLAAQREEVDDVTALFGGNWARAQTKQGHTKERVGSGGQPVRLDLSVMTEHVVNVIHDLTHRKALFDVHRLVSREDVREAIEATAGTEMYRMIRPWMVAIAGDYREPGSIVEGIMNRARFGATVVNMGLKVTTAIVQPLGYMQTVDTLGPKYAGIGLRKFYSNPLKMRERVAWALERSEQLRNRQRTFDRDVRDALKELTVAGKVSRAKQSFFFLTAMADMSVAVPTWLGAYQQAMDGEAANVPAGDEQAAIDHADSVLRLTQGSGSVKDLAYIQAQPGLLRMFTVFYSYFNVLFNLMQRRLGLTQSVKDMPRFVASMALLWFLPAVGAELLAGRGPDDDEDWDEWAARTWYIWLLYPAQSLVFVRDLASGFGPYGYDVSPAADAMEQTIRAMKGLSDLPNPDEEFDRADAKAAVLAVSYWAGLPGRQAWITGSYLYDWMTGEDVPETWQEAVRNLAYTRRE